MKKNAEAKSLQQVASLLSKLLGVARNELQVELEPAVSGKTAEQVDGKISAAGFRFAVKWKASGTAESVTHAIRQLLGFPQKSREKLIPVVAVPFMGDVGQRLCEESNVCWLDLSGNARLIAPGLRVVIEGKPNQFKRPGRPRSLFAPKSSRIARYFLMNPNRTVGQRELALATTMDEGFTSRIVRGLQKQALIVKDSNGQLRLANFDAMLEAWREAYDFTKHHVVRGHIATRSGEETLMKLGDLLRHDKAEWAATGLAGAWLLNPFAGFRLVTVYLSELPSNLEKIGFREESRGENVWLVIPNDEGVFEGATEQAGIRCVHPVQVYVDLKDHPERSAEAADELRKKLLSGERDGQQTDHSRGL